MLKKAWLRLATALLLASTSAVAVAYTPAKWNLPEGVTEMSRQVYGLHMIVFWICVIIGVGVFGVMFYSVFAHRRSRHPKPADFHESTKVEILWTTIPFLILVGMAIPAAATLIRMDDMRGAELSVKVTGYQWKWHYEYLGEDVGYYSTLAAESNRARQLNSGIDVNQVENYLVDVDNPLVLPVGRKVRFLITSNDVIHAWWVSELAVKKDAIPGYINEVWTQIEEPGTYRGVCAELCGRDHGFMPIVVEALPADEFDRWLAEQNGEGAVATAEPEQMIDIGRPASIPEDVDREDLEVDADTRDATDVAMADDADPMASNATEPAEAQAAPQAEDFSARGEALYSANCQACHQAQGQGMPPTFPALQGSAVVTGDPATMLDQIVNGKNVMPPFNHLSNEDIAAIANYVRVTWGNGDTVTPDMVQAQR